MEPDAVRPWRARLAALALGAEAASPAETARVLHEALALLCAAPAAFAPVLGGLDLREATRLHAAGTPESTALALLPMDAGYMLSRGGAVEPHIASVVLAGMAGEVTMTAANAALALIAALAAALAGITLVPNARAADSALETPLGAVRWAG